MKRLGNPVGVVALMCAFFCAMSAAWAADPGTARAARLSFFSGTVVVDRMDNTAGDPAERNMPLTELSRVTTGGDGQAEVEFEDGSVVRLTPNSALELSGLGVDAAGNFNTQMAVLHGLVYAELRAAAKFTYRVEVGAEQIWPVTNASVRIGFDEEPVILSVLSGSVHVEGTEYKTDVRAGETLTPDVKDATRYFLTTEVAQDSWDAWNEDRDRAAEEAATHATSVRDGYAGGQGYGWGDLDAYGQWYDVPGQGPVWQPDEAVDASFDPYGYGSWVGYPGAGYVWASGYAWGWTPFRCGMWSYWDSFGWGWSPVNACGVIGWGFVPGGGGYVINIAKPPQHYHAPTRPIQRAGTMRPVPVGRPVRVAETAAGTNRTIGGQAVKPIRPAGVAAVQGGSPVGAALRHDYAVEGKDNRPVTGITQQQRYEGSPYGASLPGSRPMTPPVASRPAAPPQAPRAAPPAAAPHAAPPPPPPAVSHPATPK